MSKKMLDEYIALAISFIRTLIIKVPDAALSINNALFDIYGHTAGDDRHTWKYYMNLAGIPHTYNTPVYITIIETGGIEQLTAALLLRYPATASELLKQADMYKELVDTYPTEVSYINSCMLPVPIEVSLNAKIGTILAYNKTFIEPQETSIVYELQQYIQNFFARYNVSGYGYTDDLYIASLYGILYPNLINKIVNARVSRVRTGEVHSFHVEQYFRSHLNIWNEQSVLNDKSKYWLYFNMRQLMKHTGKNVTLKLVADKVLAANNVGIGKYVLDTGEPLLVPAGPTESRFLLPEKSFTTRSVNGCYKLNNYKSQTLTDILKDEYSVHYETRTDQGAVRVETMASRTAAILDGTSYRDQDTKILDIDYPLLFSLLGVDPVLYLLEQWIYAVKTNAYIARTNYVDPNTKTVYNISPRQGLLILLKMLLTATSSTDRKLTNIYTMHIPNVETRDVDDVLLDIMGEHQIRPLVVSLLATLPIDRLAYPTQEDFKKYISGHYATLKKLWVYCCNGMNAFTSAGLKTCIGRMLEPSEYVLTSEDEGLTIDQLLALEGIEYNIDAEHDVVLAIENIFYAFTGINIDYYKSSRERYRSFIRIVNKLTSYSVQVLDKSNDTKSMFIQSTGLQPIYISVATANGGNTDGEVVYTDTELGRCTNRRGYSLIRSGRVKYPLEPADGIYIDAKGDNYKDIKPSVHVSPWYSEYKYCHGNVIGYGSTPETWNRIDGPTNMFGIDVVCPYAPAVRNVLAYGDNMGMSLSTLITSFSMHAAKITDTSLPIGYGSTYGLESVLSDAPETITSIGNWVNNTTGVGNIEAVYFDNSVSVYNNEDANTMRVDSIGITLPDIIELI